MSQSECLSSQRISVSCNPFDKRRIGCSVKKYQDILSRECGRALLLIAQTPNIPCNSSSSDSREIPVRKRIIAHYYR